MAAQLAALVPSLRVSATIPGVVNVPAAIVSPATGDLASYEVAQSSDLALWYIRIVLIVGRADEANAQNALDSYISAMGDLSVPAAIRSDPTLGGQVEWAELKSAQRYGSLQYNGVDYLGVELTVEVSC